MSLEMVEDAPGDGPVVADWTRERPNGFWDPSRKLLKSIRAYQRWSDVGGPLAFPATKWVVLRYRFWSVITQAEIGLRTRIGGGLMIPHPNGIVVHPDVTIGENTIIFQQVTLGEKFEGSGVPKIGAHVDIGAGARILGPVTIGDHAVIGANAVVTKDVPAHALARGIPATLKLNHRASRVDQSAA
ncbi:serine acetyltransferase [Yoonia sp. 2307UL14-13]|uniref:serine acetyltransferase n=1 Tax=Yoonia sp. 2307UL14-13 TaxID=3126506 RepID=UPI0030A92B6A